MQAANISREAAESMQVDGMSKFIRFVYKNYKEITALKKLQAFIDASFEKNFDAESDQISYMHKQQNSDVYKRQTRTFLRRRTMAGEELTSFKLGFGMRGDDDELSDEEGDGAIAASLVEKQWEQQGNPDEGYFTGELASFAAGCQPNAEEVKNAHAYSGIPQVDMPSKTYQDRCKCVGRLGPPKTQLDVGSAYGRFILGHQRSRELSGDQTIPAMREMNG